MTNTNRIPVVDAARLIARLIGGGRSALDLTTCDTVDFAAAVNTAAGRIGNASHERFGATKVFISAVARELGVTGTAARDSFAIRLLICRRLGLVSLARADLVGAMPRAAVAESEVVANGQEVHFVIDPAAREPWEMEVA